MKPDWDKLMEDFADSKTSLVADVDCTTEGKSLCEKHSISGYPSIKYGDPNDLKDYNGGRSYDDFKKFAEENLGPSCGPDNLDLCSEEDKALIEKYLAMSAEELDGVLGEADGKISKIEEKATKAVQKLEGQIAATRKDIEKETKKKDDTIKKEKKKLGLGPMKAVSAAKKKDDAPKKKKKDKKKKEL